MRFLVLDQDVAGTTETIGEYETSIGVIMGSRGQEHTGQLKLTGKNGNRG